MSYYRMFAGGTYVHRLDPPNKVLEDERMASVYAVEYPYSSIASDSSKDILDVIDQRPGQLLIRLKSLDKISHLSGTFLEDPGLKEFLSRAARSPLDAYTKLRQERLGKRRDLTNEQVKKTLEAEVAEIRLIAFGILARRFEDRSGTTFAVRDVQRRLKETGSASRLWGRSLEYLVSYSPTHSVLSDVEDALKDRELPGSQFASWVFSCLRNGPSSQPPLKSYYRIWDNPEFPDIVRALAWNPKRIGPHIDALRDPKVLGPRSFIGESGGVNRDNQVLQLLGSLDRVEWENGRESPLASDLF